MVTHQTQKCKQNSVPNKGNKRYIFTDNFYTRHKLAKKILVASEYETVSIGTVRANFIDLLYKPMVQSAMNELSNKPRVRWRLVTVPSKTTGTVTNRDTTTDCCGYIVWKDNKTIIFYTN